MTYTNEYGAVNGVSCSYVKLGRYNKCSNADVAKAPSLSSSDYVYKGAIPNASQSASAASAAQNSPVNPTMVGSDGQPVAQIPTDFSNPSAGVQEGYYYAEAVDPAYMPSYKVLNQAPINTNSLIHQANSCGNYPNIMSAYGGMDGSSQCQTNFINN